MRREKVREGKKRERKERGEKESGKRKRGLEGEIDGGGTSSIKLGDYLVTWPSWHHDG